MRDVACVMISCEQRSEARSETIPQLEAIGLKPRVFLSPCNPASQVSNGLVSGQALAWAAEQGKPVLFVEDDIDLGDDFVWYLGRAPDAITYFYINEQMPGRCQKLYGPQLAESVMEGRPMKRQFVKARTFIGLFGTQCVFIPQRFLALLALELTRPRKAFDGHLPAFADRHDHPIYIALPNPVQHRNVNVARTDRPAKPKLSHSFNCPRLEGV